jgi:hypothetical protein
MTILTENSNSFYFTGPVELINAERDMAAHWASEFINQNPAFKWIIGKYVEADNANSNGQYWSLEDLKMSKPSIEYAPMNMGHRQNHIVGTYVASEMMYPVEQEMNAYIETASVLWKYYFPDELAMVQKAYDIGALHQSMECIAESVTCAGPMGCGETFKYGGPMSSEYCEHIKSRESYRQLNNPHFLAGGLILPPDRPGWKNASIDEVAAFSDEELDRVYKQVSEGSPHLDPKQWEALMFEIIAFTAEKDDDNVASASHLASKAILNIPKLL